MTEIDFIEIIYNHKEHIPRGGLHDLLKADKRYQVSLQKENLAEVAYESLNLTEEQKSIIIQWMDAVNSQNAAFTQVVYRMGMCDSFCLLRQLGAFVKTSEQ